MSRYCGVCGASLGIASLTTGRCEQCNARVEDPGPSFDGRSLAAEDAPTLAGQNSADPASTHSSDRALPAPGREIASQERPLTPAPKVKEHRRSRRKSPRVPLLWVFSLLLLVTVLLTSSALFLLARSGSIHIVIAPFTSSNANSSSNSSSSSGGAATTSTGTNQTQGGGQGTGTATHAASGTATSSLLGTPTSSAARATSTPTPPFLSVSPTTFSKLLCPTSVQFTITNTGQAQLAWSASAPSGYTISPQSGIVNGGDDVVVKVSTGLLGGTVTITASGAVNSPQQVTISCL